jgi:hypothetical protein
MPNNDYILRGDAVSAICGDCKATDICRQLGEPCEEVKRINAIPAADVEPKRKSGRWIIAGAFDDFYQCPECGEMWPIFSTIEWKCCPICECRIITNWPKGEDDAEVH